ncbi:hypothetical protein [Caldimonas tepidiphila]|uniref:hypothetical protein n=1 Tax=Caldimonas tepidiphila TaxID=2315841 RepID=UPI001475D26C|nr:hypothetical protein [Caldimonas tepidiphila]
MEDQLHPILQIALGILATVSAIASAIAAFKALTTAREALAFQKRLSRHQEALFLLRVTIAALWRLKRVLGNPLQASDEEFVDMDRVHAEIKSNIDALIQWGVLTPRDSALFSATSRGEIIDQMTISNEEIDIEIKRLQAKIDEILL